MHGDLKTNIVGMIYTVALVVFFWIVAYLIKIRKPVSDLRREVARKVVHIGVGNWFFIYVHFLSIWYFPIAGLLGFAFINYLIETHTGQRRSFGTVYYPISIAIMIIVHTLGFGSIADVGCGTLGMAYADGLAALTGLMWGKTKMPIGKNKSIVGSATVFVVSTLIVFLLKDCSVYSAMIVGLISTIAELCTPFGLDNFSVPFIIYLFSTLIC